MYKLDSSVLKACSSEMSCVLGLAFPQFLSGEAFALKYRKLENISLPPSLHTTTAMGLYLGPCTCWMNVLMLRHVFIPKALPLYFLETNHSSPPPQTRSAVVQPSLELICSQLWLWPPNPASPFQVLDLAELTAVFPKLYSFEENFKSFFPCYH